MPKVARPQRKAAAEDEGGGGGEAGGLGDRGEQRAGHQELRGAEGEGVAPDRFEPLQLQLQTHLEEEEHDAQLGELGGGLDVRDHGETSGAQEHARKEEAEDGREADQVHRGRDEGGRREQVHGVALRRRDVRPDVAHHLLHARHGVRR